MSEKHDPAPESVNPSGVSSGQPSPASHPSGSAGDAPPSTPPITLESWLAAAPIDELQLSETDSDKGPNLFAEEDTSGQSHSDDFIDQPISEQPIAADPVFRPIIQLAPPPMQVLSIPLSSLHSWDDPERFDPPIAQDLTPPHLTPPPTIVDESEMDSPSAYHAPAEAESEVPQLFEQAADVDAGGQEPSWEPTESVDEAPTTPENEGVDFLEEAAAAEGQPVDVLPIHGMTEIAEQPREEESAVAAYESSELQETPVPTEEESSPAPVAPASFNPPPADEPPTDDPDALLARDRDTATHPHDDLADLFENIDDVPVTPVSLGDVPEPVESPSLEPSDPLAVDFAISNPSEIDVPPAPAPLPVPETIATEIVPPLPLEAVSATQPDAKPTADDHAMAQDDSPAEMSTEQTPPTAVAESAQVEPVELAPAAFTSAEPSNVELSAIPVEATVAAALPAIAAGALVSSASAPETVGQATATQVFEHAHHDVEERRGILGLGLLTKLSGLVGFVACIAGLLMLLMACAGLTPTDANSLTAINNYFVQWLAVGLAVMLVGQIGLTLLTKASWKGIVPTVIVTLLATGLTVLLKLHSDQLAGYPILPWSIYIIYTGLGGLGLAILGGLIEHRRMKEESHVLAAVFTNTLAAVGGTLLLAVAEGWKIFGK